MQATSANLVVDPLATRVAGWACSCGERVTGQSGKHEMQVDVDVDDLSGWDVRVETIRRRVLRRASREEYLAPWHTSGSPMRSLQMCLIRAFFCVMELME